MEKPLAEFAYRDKPRGKLKAICRLCESARVRAYYAGNEEARTRTKERAKIWRDLHPEAMPAIARRGLLKSKYGMTVDQYEALRDAQGNQCALCGSSHPGRLGKDGKWAAGHWNIDHDHADGHVRGLLCHQCNVRIGAYEGLRNDIGFDKVLDYLSRPSPVVEAPPPPPVEYVKHDAPPPIDYGRPRGECGVEGCGKPHFGNGLCAMHYARVQRGGDVGPAEHLPHQTPGRGAAHPKAKLTDDDVRAIRASSEKGAWLAERYGVTATLISNIRQGKVWRHVQ